MKPDSYYSPDGDLVAIHVRPSNRTRTEEHGWGLLDYDAQTGELASIEIWQASSVLPAGVVKALPQLGRSDHVLTREDLAKPQPA